MTPTEQLALSIQARGEIISSNFPEFAEMVRNHLATFNRELKSDDDFDQADKDAKAIASAESTLKAAKEKALADAVQLNNLFEQIDGLTGELASARLDLTRQIAKRKEEIKAEIVEDALGQIDIDPMDARRLYTKPIMEAMMRKRTIDTMRVAAYSCAHMHMLLIGDNRKAIAAFESANGPELTMDRRELENKSQEYVHGELRRRLEAKQAHDEKRRLEAEAAQARKEAEEAKAAPVKGMLPPDTLPKPPKIDSIKVGATTPAPNDPEAEWAQWLNDVLEAFGKLKTSRARLIHAPNIEAAAILANAVSPAFVAMKQHREEIA